MKQGWTDAIFSPRQTPSISPSKTSLPEHVVGAPYVQDCSRNDVSASQYPQGLDFFGCMMILFDVRSYFEDVQRPNPYTCTFTTNGVGEAYELLI